MGETTFEDRAQAGRLLASDLEHLRGEDVVVLGLPRGGVPVAAEVARTLGAPLDVVIVRKLGVPFQRELAMGAIGEGGVRVVEEEIVRRAGLDERDLAAAEKRERVELERRVDRYREGRQPIDVEGKTVVIVDDGIATGATARAAAKVVRAMGASRVVLACPVGPPEVRHRLGADVDELVVGTTPRSFQAIGQFYRDFTQVSDEEVRQLLGLT